MDWNDTLKALADPNRLRILNLLDNRTLCVCDLEEVLDLNQSNLSRHLAKLKAAGLVTAQKKGLFMYYARRPVPAPFSPVLDALYTAVSTDPAWSADRDALAARLGCEDGCC
jgi:ArsR family transcriptional regulator, arsenate/arsenite/antimonite-responsive transcriptional repressor